MCTCVYVDYRLLSKCILWYLCKALDNSLQNIRGFKGPGFSQLFLGFVLVASFSVAGHAGRCPRVGCAILCHLVPGWSSRMVAVFFILFCSRWLLKGLKENAPSCHMCYVSPCKDQAIVGNVLPLHTKHEHQHKPSFQASESGGSRRVGARKNLNEST